MRACSTKLENGMHIERQSQRAKEAQTEAMDRILEIIYCIVPCDNNNGNCKVHNTVHMMGIEEQKYPYEPKVVLVKWICHIRFIGMIQINVLLVDSV